MIEITIPREWWMRGPYTINKNNDNISRLFDPRTLRQCCVGHILSNLGAPQEKLRHVSASKMVTKHIPKEAFWLVAAGMYRSDTDDAMSLYRANDKSDRNPLDTDAKKEKEIKRICKKHGLLIKFIGARLPKRNGVEIKYEEK